MPKPDLSELTCLIFLRQALAGMTAEEIAARCKVTAAQVRAGIRRAIVRNHPVH